MFTSCLSFQVSKCRSIIWQTTVALELAVSTCVARQPTTDNWLVSACSGGNQVSPERMPLANDGS